MSNQTGKNFHKFRIKYLWHARKAFPRILKSMVRYRFFKNATYLRSLSILLGYKCQCKCEFCSVEPLRGNEGEPLTLKEWKDIIDQSLHLGVINVTISGGEPLLYSSKLIPLIEYVNSKRAICTIATTGHGLYNELDKLKKAGLSNIFISLGGIGKKHDDSRFVPGLFNEAFSAIVKAREMGFFVGVRGIASNENIEDGSFEELLDFLEKHNLLFTATPVYSGTAKQDAGIEVMTPENSKKLLALQDAHANLMLDVFANLNYPACPAAQEWITILSDGETVPCAGIMTSFGSLRDVSVENMLKKIRSTPEFGSICRVCRSGEDSEFANNWVAPIVNMPQPVRAEDHPFVSKYFVKDDG